MGSATGGARGAGQTARDDVPSSREVADALWDGVRHATPLARADGGWRAWYLNGPYARVADRRRSRVWAHRSAEPWLTVQWILERGATPRSRLRFEGFPGEHSYEAAYRAVAEGRFDRPFVYVAGFSRSGTTSVQNVVLAAFPDHVPPGSWSDPDHPLRLWWYPKHDVAVARRIAACAPNVARVVLCVRPFVDAAASLALYEGITDSADVTREWVTERAAEWQGLADLAQAPGVVTVPFGALSSSSPAEFAAALADRLGIPASAGIDPTTSWDEVYTGRISPEELDNPYLSNLPHGERPVRTARLRDRVVELLGSAADELEDAYAEMAAG